MKTNSASASARVGRDVTALQRQLDEERAALEKIYAMKPPVEDDR